jgi:hypothetical protein
MGQPSPYRAKRHEKRVEKKRKATTILCQQAIITCPAGRTKGVPRPNAFDRTIWLETIVHLHVRPETGREVTKKRRLVARLTHHPDGIGSAEDMLHISGQKLRGYIYCRRPFSSLLVNRKSYALERTKPLASCTSGITLKSTN